MDTRAPFIAHVEPAKLMEPGQRALDDPARLSETTAMLGPTLRQLRLNPAAVEGVAVDVALVNRPF